MIELKKRKVHANKEWIEKLPVMAKRLEEALYRQAASKEEYQDLATLKVRLQQVAMSMGKKCERRYDIDLTPFLIHLFPFDCVWLQVPSRKVERVQV